MELRLPCIKSGRAEYVLYFQLPLLLGRHRDHRRLPALLQQLRLQQQRQQQQSQQLRLPEQQQQRQLRLSEQQQQLRLLNPEGGPGRPT